MWSRCCSTTRIGITDAESIPLLDFLTYLAGFRSSSSKKQDHAIGFLGEILYGIGDIMEVARDRGFMWDKIDHLDLGVLRSAGEHSRRMPGKFKHQLVVAARNCRGKGVRRPSQLACSLSIGKKARSENPTLSAMTGYRCELLDSWNYWLSTRISPQLKWKQSCIYNINLTTSHHELPFTEML